MPIGPKFCMPTENDPNMNNLTTEYSPDSSPWSSVCTNSLLSDGCIAQLAYNLVNIICVIPLLLLDTALSQVRIKKCQMGMTTSS